MTKKQHFLRGMRAGIPICLGYFAVSLALGISAANGGITAFQAALTSLFINASAGEYAGFNLISGYLAQALTPALAVMAYLEVTMMEAVANARYLLMSASMSQKLESRTTIGERLLLGFTVTDEIFGVSMSLDGKLSPYFTYGAFVVATFGWTSGTFLGAVLGSVLPLRLISALGVGLYGMFISVFIPAAKKNRVVAALVIISFIASLAFTLIPIISQIPEGIRIIVLTVAISLIAAIFFPIKEDEQNDQ